MQAVIRRESLIYGDIIQVNLIDKYGIELTNKTVAMLHWSHHYCPQAEYIMKTDDDVYLNVHNLARVLHKLQSQSLQGIFGTRIPKSPVALVPVHRNPRNIQI